VDSAFGPKVSKNAQTKTPRADTNACGCPRGKDAWEKKKKATLGAPTCAAQGCSGTKVGGKGGDRRRGGKKRSKMRMGIASLWVSQAGQKSETIHESGVRKAKHQISPTILQEREKKKKLRKPELKNSLKAFQGKPPREVKNEN